MSWSALHVAGILARGFLVATVLLSTRVGAVEEAETYLAVGRAMLETHRGQELYDWLPGMPSDVARAFACIDAAEGLKPPRPLGSQ